MITTELTPEQLHVFDTAVQSEIFYKTSDGRFCSDASSDSTMCGRLSTFAFNLLTPTQRAADQLHDYLDKMVHAVTCCTPITPGDIAQARALVESLRPPPTVEELAAAVAAAVPNLKHPPMPAEAHEFSTLRAMLARVPKDKVREILTRVPE